ncbi:MAG: hypothetical protein JRH20_27765 [Deltaproteobacteria bacterium]|nr:hypothetical protein [Deltaproteobacteria bacterium]
MPTDAPVDATPVDSSVDTLPADSIVSRVLTCDPVVAFTGSSAIVVAEPAISLDGLTLLRGEPTAYTFSGRTTLTKPFGLWARYADPWSATTDKEDTTFFSQPDGVHAMVAKRVSMRTIFHCPPSQATCEQINLYHRVGGAVLDSGADVDGPSVSDALELIFNYVKGASWIYRATPRDASLRDWDAEVLFSEVDGARLDDPAITRDGSLVVVADFRPTVSRLGYAFRNIDGSYGLLKWLEGLGLGSPIGNPEVYRHPDGSYELFIRDYEVPGLYSTRCR